MEAKLDSLLLQLLPHGTQYGIHQQQQPSEARTQPNITSPSTAALSSNQSTTVDGEPSEVLSVCSSLQIPAKPFPSPDMLQLERGLPRRPFRQHDVFLSFRGRDTRRGFTSHLYSELERNGVRTFTDNSAVEKGHSISERIHQAIESSEMAIPIFSPSFADSKWCLDELGKIVECELLLLPIFYDVQPSDVRNQTGPYAVAFKKHGEDFPVERVRKWRNALGMAGQKAGFTLHSVINETELIQKVVEKVLKELDRIKPSRMLPTSELSGTTSASCQKRLMELLEDPAVHKIGVVGMGGVGKTGLVRHVYNELQNASTRVFDYVIYVKAPYEPNPRNVRREIMKQVFLVDNQADEEDEWKAVISLRERLNGSKFLLILDDLWRRMDLRALGVPDNDEEEHNGHCKVIVTSRNIGVCRLMGTQADVTVSPLSFEKSWEFFCQRVGEISSEIVNNDTAKDIVRWCGGVPVGLLAVAEVLRNERDLTLWNFMLGELRCSRPLNERMKVDVFDRLRLSYDRLESQKLKNIFMACAFYIADYHVDIWFLIGQLRAEGLEDDCDECYRLIDKLKKACMIASVTDSNCVRLEGLMEAMARYMKRVETLSRDGRHIEYAPTLEEWESAERISLRLTSVTTLPRQPYCPRLVALGIRGSTSIHDVSDTVFKQMERLRVLDMGETTISRLPTSLPCLLNLRHLCLDHCGSLKSIEGVGNLKNLMYLFLTESCIESFPSDMSHLSKLIALHAENTKHLQRIPRGAVSQLCSLVFLLMEGSAYSWNSNPAAEEEASLGELKCLPLLSQLTCAVAREEDFEHLKSAAGTQCWTGIRNLQLTVNGRTRFYDPKGRTWSDL